MSYGSKRDISFDKHGYQPQDEVDSAAFGIVIIGSPHLAETSVMGAALSRQLTALRASISPAP